MMQTCCEFSYLEEMSSEIKMAILLIFHGKLAVNNQLKC